MKKILILVLTVILIVLGVYLFTRNSVPTDLETANVIDAGNNAQNVSDINISELPPTNNFSFTFTGYGPAGKFHDGTFKEISIEGNTATFKTASVETGIDGLDTHLCSADFFDCLKYPNITFTANQVSKISDNEYEVKGVVTFKDITKEVSFKANVENNQKVSADFLLDTSEFGFNPALVENEVRIRFSFDI